MSGYHDAADPHFSDEVLPHFNVIAGTTNDLVFVNSLSAQGKLFSHHVHNDPNATTWQQLVNIWGEPFTRGLDAVHIDELHPWANGTADSNRVVTALQKLREQYPDKIISAWTRWQLSDNPSLYSDQLNAVNQYADLHLVEKYSREGNPQYHLFEQYSNNLIAEIPGLLNKTIFGLYISQAGFIADDTTNLGYWGLLDEQFHLIRNDPQMATMPGIAFWIYYRSERLTAEYLGKLVNHYYVQNNTDYFSDGNTVQLVTNPQFDSSTADWQLFTGAGGFNNRFNYSSEGVLAQHDDFGQASHGSHGLKMARGGSANTASYAITVDPQQTYTVSAWVLAGSGSVNNATVKITTDTGQLIAEKLASQTIDPVGGGPWKRIQFNFALASGQDDIKIVLSDESVGQGTTLYWDFVELEEAFATEAVIPPGGPQVQVFLSPSDTNPIVTNPRLNVGPGNTTSLYVWVIPDASQVLSVGLDVESTDPSVLQATAHQIYDPYFALADRDRWDFTDGGTMGDLIVGSVAVAFSEGLGISAGLGALDPPLFDAATGAFLHSRIDLQAQLEGQTELYIKIGDGMVQWSLTEEILGGVTFGDQDQVVPSSLVGGTGLVADATINVTLVGDVDGSGAVDDLDIDVLRNAIADQATDSVFDFNGDTFINGNDVNHLVTDILQTSIGDVNLDQRIDAMDMAIIRRNYGTSISSGILPWGQGNLTGDGSINEFDLLATRFNFGYDSTTAPAQSQTPSPPVAQTAAPAFELSRVAPPAAISGSYRSSSPAVSIQLPVFEGETRVITTEVEEGPAAAAPIDAVRPSAYRDLIDGLLVEAGLPQPGSVLQSAENIEVLTLV